MFKKINIKSNGAWFSVFGLAFLLLISPCKVRNYIQAELGIPQTEVANKGKTTISNLNCATTTITDYSLNPSRLLNNYLPIFAISNLSNILNAIGIQSKSIVPCSNKKRALTLVPLYILHQNFKFHL